jgi:hypothetical protein
VSLFNRYLRAAGPQDWFSAVWNVASGGGLTGSRFPLVDVGGYLQTYVGQFTPADLESVSQQNVPFGTIQRSLQTGRLTHGESPSLLADANSEANLLTALICHADGSRPRSVCSRPTILSMTKVIK